MRVICDVVAFEVVFAGVFAALGFAAFGVVFGVDDTPGADVVAGATTAMLALCDVVAVLFCTATSGTEAARMKTASATMHSAAIQVNNDRENIFSRILGIHT